jgi:hypothetical protein
MNYPLINACAGDLDMVEEHQGQVMAHRLVLSMIVGSWGAVAAEDEFGDPSRLWWDTKAEIASLDEVDAVLELLANVIAQPLIEKLGYQAAARHVQQEIAELGVTR